MDARDTDIGAIIAGWRNGDESAVRTLFDVYYPKAVRLATLSGLSADEAEDCAQEAFVRAFERRAQLRDPTAFSVWFYRIATSQILIVLERRRRAQTPSAEQAEDWQRNRSPQPDEVAIAEEDRERLWRQVQALPPRQRLAIALRYYGGYSTREVAEILGMREGAVRVMLHRALRHLREGMGGGLAQVRIAPATSLS